VVNKFFSLSLSLWRADAEVNVAFSASKVTTFWRYTNLFIIIFLPQVVQIPGVKNYQLKTTESYYYYYYYCLYDRAKDSFSRTAG